jgi:hypothetical protein
MSYETKQERLDREYQEEQMIRDSLRFQAACCWSYLVFLCMLVVGLYWIWENIGG